MLDMEEAIEMALQSSSFESVLARHVIRLLQFTAHTGSLLVNLLLVPSLLEEVCAVAVSVGVAECDILDIVGRKRFGAWREVVLRFGHDERMASDKDVHQH